MTKDRKNILVVDDDPVTAEIVASLLEGKGFGVFRAGNGLGALKILESESIALVLLDLILPDIPGEEVCRRIRLKSRVPVIMLSAKTGEGDVVGGLGLGADDYITKPFGLKELYARVEAVLRRAGGDGPLAGSVSWRGGDLSVDFAQGSVRKKGAEAALTPSEQRILYTLAQNPSKVYSRGQIIERALGDDFDGYDRTVDSHIKNLRKKIEDDPKNPVYVVTVPGMGYKFGG